MIVAYTDLPTSAIMTIITAMRKLTDTQVAEIGRLYGAGALGRELGKQYGVTQTTIYAALDKLGIARRPSRCELNKVTAQQIEEAIRRYRNGEMLSAIAAEYGVTYANLARHLRLQGVAKYPNGYQSRAFSPAEDEEIGRRYDAGENLYDLARAFETSAMTVRNAILRTGRKTRNPKVAHRQYALDEKAFGTLTNEAAYWIGFLTADGCVMSGPKQSWVTSASVKGEDKAHLEKFARFLSYEGPIYDSRRDDCAIRISSDRIAQDLMHWGLAERKSLNENPHPDLLANVEFWRGEIDGDGCICMAKGNYPGQLLPVLTLVGGERLVTAFANWVKTFAKTQAMPRCNKHGLWRFEAKCAPAVDVIRKLYADCDPALALDRKLARAQAILTRWPNGYDGPATQPLWD